MLSIRRLSALEARHVQHVEALAEALAQVHADVLTHVPDAQLRLMMDDALGFTDGAQWYAFLQHDCGVPAELVAQLRRADVALQPFTETAAYKAWHERYLRGVYAEIARLESELAAANAQDAQPGAFGAI